VRKKQRNQERNNWIELDHGFSNCGTRTTTGTQTIVYWYAALIKNLNIKKDNNFKKQIKHEPHVITNTQYCR
jgi:hypothetical protein